MNTSAQNAEDASTIVQEFIYSIDNLPNEVAHLLQEIKVKESRSQELQQEIDRDTAKYVRHALRPSPSSGSSTVSPSPSASRAPSPKSSHLPAKVADAYAEIRQLGDDKCLLAKRLIELLTRTRSRLDVDLNKVRILQGELADYHAVSTRSASVLSSPAIGGQSDILYGRNPAQQISESLRNALGGSASMPDVKSASALPPPPAFASVPIPKKRRLGTSTSVKLASAASPAPSSRSGSPAASVAASSHAHSTHQRSRLSRQILPQEDVDMDAEGEDDAEGDDERPYCFCQKPSYGDMIACDNNNCPYEWFHLSCVQLRQPVPEKWYCDHCVQSGLGSLTGTRKGRKK